jgi:hypothetical protein
VEQEPDAGFRSERAHCRTGSGGRTASLRLEATSTLRRVLAGGARVGTLRLSSIAAEVRFHATSVERAKGKKSCGRGQNAHSMGTLRRGCHRCVERGAYTSYNIDG